MSNIKEINIEDLIPDNQNANSGNETGKRIIKRSIESLGIGRGILVDKNNQIIAGNQATNEIIEQGYKKAILVETEGDVLVVTKRKDVDLNSKTGRELAIADNKTSELNLTWDEFTLNELSEEHDIDLEKWGFDIKNDEDEENEQNGNANDVFEIIIECDSETHQEKIFQDLVNQGYTCRVLTL